MVSNIIMLIGPNAIGKTTTVRRLCKKYGSILIGVLADNQITIFDGVDQKEKGWQSGEENERVAIARKYERLGKMVLVEAAAGYGVRIAKAFTAPFVFCVTCSGKQSSENIRQRCIRTNKEFRADYWTPEKCSYDSERRHVNFCQSSIPADRWATVRVENQEDGWVEFDAQFSRVFVRLRNQRLLNG